MTVLDALIDAERAAAKQPALGRIEESAFEEALHPRNVMGEFRKKVGALKAGESASLPDGHKVTHVESMGGGTKFSRYLVSRPTDKPGTASGVATTTPERAAAAAGDLSADSRHPKSIGGERRFPSVSAASVAMDRDAAAARKAPPVNGGEVPGGRAANARHVANSPERAAAAETRRRAAAPYSYDRVKRVPRDNNFHPVGAGVEVRFHPTLPAGSVRHGSDEAPFTGSKSSTTGEPLPLHTKAHQIISQRYRKHVAPAKVREALAEWIDFEQAPHEALGRAARRLSNGGALYVGGGIGVEKTGEKFAVMKKTGKGETFPGPLSAVTRAYTLAGASTAPDTPGGGVKVADPAASARLHELGAEERDTKQEIERVNARLRRKAERSPTGMPSLPGPMDAQDDSYERRRLSELSDRLARIEKERTALIAGKLGELQEAFTTAQTAVGQAQRQGGKAPPKQRRSPAPTAPGSGRSDPSKHPHAPAGTRSGGQFVSSSAGSSEQVRTVQHHLGAKTDGKFGDATKKAVMDFQRKHGLQVDGIVGHQTAVALAGGDGKSAKVGALKGSDHSKLSRLRSSQKGTKAKRGRAPVRAAGGQRV